MDEADDKTKHSLQKAFEIFGELVDLPPRDRDARLETLCMGDGALQQQVLKLLANDERAGRFLAPLVDVRELRVGHSFAQRYDITEVLGEGGMSAIYKAWDRELDKFVVIKVIHPSLAGSKKLLRRLKQELLLTRQIAHENVIRIFDIGEADGMKFITMEYIEGCDLKKVLSQRGKFTTAEALPIMRQICSALHAAHEKDVIHRDLKPQNIMRQTDGRVVVTDFGIAHSDHAQRMTATGEAIGTPEYMSPEQARGQRIDKRSDIFSLGLVFYELLTGELPFKGENPTETKYKRMNEKPRFVGSIEKTIPKQLDRVIMRCLEVDTTKRYATVSDILSDLNAIDALSSPAGSETIIPTLFKPRSTNAALVLCVSIVIVVAAFVFLFYLRK